MKMNKELKNGFLNMVGVCIALLFFAGITYGAISSYSNWNRQKIMGQTITSILSNTVRSEASERFSLTSPQKEVIFFINATTTLNQSYLMGMFKMSYKTKIDIEDPTKTYVDVLYYLPENWLIENASDFNISAEFKLRNPPIKAEPRRDPTFYKGKDYPDSIPFDEIEITTDFVSIYTDTNETEYNFRIGVRENSDLFNIREIELITPQYVAVDRR